MTVVARAIVTSALGMLLTAAAAAQAPNDNPFVFDPADEMAPATVLDNPNYYDADIASTDDELWITWLEFVPGEGDHLWLGRWKDGRQVLKQRVLARPDVLANPTVAITSQGKKWLTFEAQNDGQWDIFRLPMFAEGSARSLRIGTITNQDIRHRTACSPDGGMWVVWQGAHDGQFDVYAQHLPPGDALKPVLVSESSPWSDWQPDVTVTQDGTVYVVWDGYDGDSYTVYGRICRSDKWGEVFTIAGTPAFEGRASVAATPDGRVWVAWEEGSRNWGKPYRSRMHLKGNGYMELTDTCGPLHGFRQVRLAAIEPDGTVRHLQTQLPMPSIDLAKQRPDAPDDVELLGAFYERAVLTVDHAGRLWIVYRHYYAPWIGLKKISHVEAGWGLYARCLTDSGWSRSYRFDVGQGDGMQRLELTPHGDGVAAVWTTGRTDRRENDRPRGIVLGTLTATGKAPADVALAAPVSSVAPRQAIPPAAQPAPPRPETVAGKEYQLFFGDLHRHTDLSLCFVPCDGTMDDAYRYAIDVAKLDFLGITDHSRDLALGNALSQLWWRCRKEVIRHDLKPNFYPMFAHERSRGGEDHNVISLRPDVLRPDTYAHSEFWKELDNDTITIPHQTMTNPTPPSGEMPLGLDTKTWDQQDNARRPLIEIYQGCRDRSIERDAHEALARRYLLGFIASSDHASTAASYAGVWAESRTRESIFRAMQARRTFAATDKIRLVLRAGDHWMGELFTAPAFGPVQIDVDGTAVVESIDVIIDGNVAKTLPGGQRRLSLTCEPEPVGDGFHYLYIRLKQADGNQAWSSPIWVDVQPGNAPQTSTDAPTCCPPQTKAVAGT